MFLELARSGVERRIIEAGSPLSQAEALQRMAESPALGQLLTRDLVEDPARAFFFECAPMLPGRLEAEFRYVVLPTGAFERRRPDPRSFEGLLPEPINRFANLSGDAWLVAPSPQAAPGSTHLALFLRTAPEALVETFWTEAALACRDWLEQRRSTLWLSSSGLGVPWLHLRLDRRPKYYTHRPYREL